MENPGAHSESYHRTFGIILEDIRSHITGHAHHGEAYQNHMKSDQSERKSYHIVIVDLQNLNKYPNHHCQQYMCHALHSAPRRFCHRPVL